jgi:hypothetical protein
MQLRFWRAGATVEIGSGNFEVDVFVPFGNNRSGLKRREGKDAGNDALRRFSPFLHRERHTIRAGENL